VQLEDKLREGMDRGEIPDDSFFDDRMLVRFLKARQYDVCKSYEMIKSYFKWRKDYKVDHIKFDDVKDCLIKEQMYVMGKNKEGYPTLVIFAGKNHYTNVDHLERLLVFVMENEIRKLRSPIESFGLILDLKGLSIKNFDREVEKRIFAVFQNYYPERLHKAYILNAPSIFMMGWKIIKNILAPETVDKIKFISKSDDLRSYFETHQLSERYGGTSHRTWSDWYLEIEQDSKNRPAASAPSPRGSPRKPIASAGNSS